MAKNDELSFDMMMQNVLSTGMFCATYRRENKELCVTYLKANLGCKFSADASILRDEFCRDNSHHHLVCSPM